MVQTCLSCEDLSHSLLKKKKVGEMGNGALPIFEIQTLTMGSSTQQWSEALQEKRKSQYHAAGTRVQIRLLSQLSGAIFMAPRVPCEMEAGDRVRQPL